MIIGIAPPTGHILSDTLTYLTQTIHRYSREAVDATGHRVDIVLVDENIVDLVAVALVKAEPLQMVQQGDSGFDTVEKLRIVERTGHRSIVDPIIIQPLGDLYRALGSKLNGQRNGIVLIEHPLRKRQSAAGEQTAVIHGAPY